MVKYGEISEFEMIKMNVLMNSGRWPSAVSVFVALALALQACASVPPRNAVPEERINQATVPGGSTARMWGDALPANLDERKEILAGQIAASGDEDVLARRFHYLSISGGGANGAFGAGLLKGWTESGTRPEMWIVTGISTGALIAPFAFIGSSYDDELEDLYTTMSTSDLVKKRSLLKGLTGDALADTSPMRELLKKYVDEEMIDLMKYQRAFQASVRVISMADQMMTDLINMVG